MKRIIIVICCVLYASCSSAQDSIDALLKKYADTEKAVQQCFANKDYKKAEKILLDAEADCMKAPSSDQQKSMLSGITYNLTCIYSLQNDKKKAVDYFGKAIEYGFTNYSHAKADSDLDNIRTDKRFVQLLENLREKSDYLYLLRQAEQYRCEDISFLSFKYEDAGNANLKLVKEYFKLDSIAGQGDDISKVINLLKWVHDNIRHDGNHRAICEYDAIDIYNYHKSTKCGVNCRMLATVLNECYLAVGLKSRFVTCLPKDPNDPDCHVINCVYIPGLQKWVWMDPANNAYLKDENGILLSIAEVRERLIKNQTIILNSDANWNNIEPQTKAEYIDKYMAKNLYWIQCTANSYFNTESPYRRGEQPYISLVPVGFQPESGRTSSVLTNDPDYFWQTPN